MEEVLRTQEAIHEGRGRVAIDLFRRAHLLPPAVVHQHHAVGHFQRFFLVVGDEDRGDVQLVVEPAQPAAQLLAHLGVQRAEGLVEQQHPRLDRQRPGQAIRWRWPPESCDGSGRRSSRAAPASSSVTRWP